MHLNDSTTHVATLIGSDKAMNLALLLGGQFFSLLSVSARLLHTKEKKNKKTFYAINLWDLGI